MPVKLSAMPDPPREYVLDFPRLDGGLNLWELDYRMDANQSPEMVNLWWNDGVLSSRNGQVWLTGEEDLGTCFTCFQELFWGHAVVHIGAGIYTALCEDGTAEMTFAQVCDGVPENRGTFFRYGDSLYYKNRGGYFKISYTDGGFTAGPVSAYVPITYINTEPTTHAGDKYQPENRLSPTQTVWYSVVKGVTQYHLPVSGIDSVDKVVVDEVELVDGEGYAVDKENGVVTLVTEPTVHDPFVANTVKVTFTKVNQDAYDSVMDCPYAAVYGGDQNLCVVVGGCAAQPNAYFWCGNHTVMDPGYFPFEQYNFAGDTEEAITGFGKQQAMLVVFKERSIGRAGFETTEMSSGRVMLSMPYTNINSRVGCDLPWSIQLVENNLVFCNTEQGVHMVRDSSAAYENNIVCISRNVNGTDLRPGLLASTRGADVTASFDDDNRYWLVAGGAAYVWDYSMSTYSEPSWFYFTNIGGVAFFKHNEHGYHVNASGRVTAFRRVFADYSGPIEKKFKFATQNMGGYDRLKDVTGVLLTIRSDTDTVMDVTYSTDYGDWVDLTPVSSYNWRMAPRNLAYRFLGVRRFATVARRKPGCRHIRHFSMTLTNDKVGQDMSVVSAQIFYRYQGRDR